MGAAPHPESLPCCGPVLLLVRAALSWQLAVCARAVKLRVTWPSSVIHGNFQGMLRVRCGSLQQMDGEQAGANEQVCVCIGRACQWGREGRGLHASVVICPSGVLAVVRRELFPSDS